MGKKRNRPTELANPKVGEGEREGIRGVRRWQVRERQQHPYHRRHLGLLRLTRARDSALHVRGCVFEDVDSAPGQRGQHHSPCVSELGSGLRILVEEQGLDGSHVRAVLEQQSVETLVDVEEAECQRLARIEVKDAVRDVPQPSPLPAHEPPTEVTSPWIDAKREHAEAVAGGREDANVRATPPPPTGADVEGRRACLVLEVPQS